jgi:ATP-binding protein involved in chromosome partitioning
MLTHDKIEAALKKVIHPEKGIDIISMGIVTQIDYDGNGISIILEPEKSNDPFLSSLKTTIVKVLKESLGPDITISGIEIRPKVILGKKEEKADNPVPGIENIIAVSSGKGGVGKTTVAVNLAIALAKKGNLVGLLDADVFGPSVPKMLAAENFRPEVKRENNTDVIVPLQKFGVKVLSTGFFVDPSEAVVWRGPMASGFLKQLITQGEWGKLDYLIVDLPPGTSDIHLTLVQEVSVTGAIVVTTPQEVALADAIKGISMFRSEKINVPVLGLVENMSWFTPAELPENKYYIFGREGGKKLAEKMGVPLLGQIPLVQSICESGDSGQPVANEDSQAGNAFKSLAEAVIEKINERNRELKPTVRVEINK